MYSLTISGQAVTCDSPQEVTSLIAHCGTIAGRQTTPAKQPTTPAKTGPKWLQKKRARTTAATKKARAAIARASYKKKKEAKLLTKKDAAAKETLRLLTKKDAEAEAITTAKEVITTAETHHGAKPKRADTSGAVIATLRRSGLPLTISEVQGDLQKSGWKYRGTDPKGTIRATLARLVRKGEVAREQRNGDITFRMARVEHADPLPHQQREGDV